MKIVFVFLFSLLMIAAGGAADVFAQTTRTLLDKDGHPVVARRLGSFPVPEWAGRNAGWNPKWGTGNPTLGYRPRMPSKRAAGSLPLANHDIWVAPSKSPTRKLSYIDWQTSQPWHLENFGRTWVTSGRGVKVYSDGTTAPIYTRKMAAHRPGAAAPSAAWGIDRQE